MLRNKILLIGMIVLCWTSFVHARSFDDCSRLELRVGGWTNGNSSYVSAGFPDITVSTNNGGGMGILEFSHWFEEGLAFSISTGGLVTETNVKIDGLGAGATTQTTTITPILIGIKYYFPKSSYESSMRPFVTTKLGMYVGHIVSTEASFTFQSSSQTESAMGGFVGGGVDFRVSRRFVMGLNMGYHGMMDFQDQLGSRKNYSGGEFSFGVSLLFGGDVKR